MVISWGNTSMKTKISQPSAGITSSCHNGEFYDKPNSSGWKRTKITPEAN